MIHKSTVILISIAVVLGGIILSVVLAEPTEPEIKAEPEPTPEPIFKEESTEPIEGELTPERIKYLTSVSAIPYWEAVTGKRITILTRDSIPPTLWAGKTRLTPFIGGQR